jgi:hypothetical protein
MTTLSSSLLDFILSLLRDPQAAESFAQDPQAALSAAGLGDVCSADVRALMPMLADYAPVGGSYGMGGHHVPGGQHSTPASHVPSHHPSPGHEDHEDAHEHDHGHDEHGHGGQDHDGGLAIEHIRYIQATYTYTTNNTTTIDASHSIWGDSYKIFGDENVIATGGSVAAGDRIDSASIDNGTHVDVHDSFNPTTNDVHGSGNAVGEGTSVSDSFNPEHSFDTDISNSGNTQSGTGNVLGEHNDVSTENSGNAVHGDGNALGNDAEAGLHTDISDSGNTTVHGDGNAVGQGNDVSNTALDLHTDDVVLGDHNAVGNETEIDTDVDSHDTTTSLDHSFDGNDVAFAGHEVDQSSLAPVHDDAHLMTP